MRDYVSDHFGPMASATQREERDAGWLVLGVRVERNFQVSEANPLGRAGGYACGRVLGPRSHRGGWGIRAGPSLTDPVPGLAWGYWGSERVSCIGQPVGGGRWLHVCRRFVW